jgi:hypothetical protein
MPLHQIPRPSTQSPGFIAAAKLANLQNMNFFTSLAPTYRAGAGLQPAPAPRLLVLFDDEGNSGV